MIDRLVRMEEVAPRVHRWTVPHPAWDPDAEPESAGDWPQDIGSVAYEAPEHLVLVDPLLVEDGWAALDALVERHGKPVAVLTTTRFHGRSRAAVAERYGAALVSHRAEPLAGVAGSRSSTATSRWCGSRPRVRSCLATN